MTIDHSEFSIGRYRPIYLWGGSGTIRMNRLKFMDQPVNQDAHYQVHQPDGANTVLGDLYCNWVHLMYDWGFPPEVEELDWEEFRQAAQVYHEHGSKVFAYIQTSNCVFDGSFKTKDWYALDAQCKKVYYYSGRYMTDLTHPDWVQHLKHTVKGAIERGADGIFFDNMWHGEMPVSLFGAWLGAAGCHCERCQKDYQAASGKSIPTTIDGQDPQAQDYLRWRADQVTGLIQELEAYIQELQPGTPVSANDYDIIMRPSYLIYGQDTHALAQIPHKVVTMIENFALPRWNPAPRERLANNALTIRNAHAIIVNAAHLSVLSYDVGIGFDPAYPPRRYQQGIGEAAACGASMTIKGTEYYDEGTHTVLTPEKFAPIQQAIGKYNRWLETHADLYDDRQNAAPVGFLFPGEKLWQDWHRLAPLYLGAGQTLLQAGIPWRVVRPEDELQNLQALLVFDAAKLDKLHLPDGFPVIMVPAVEGWQPGELSLLGRVDWLRRTTERAAHRLMNAYMGNRTARSIMDKLGMAKLITQTPLFYLPPENQRQPLLEVLPNDLRPLVKAREPVLVDVWRKAGEIQVHLLNYAAQPQMVSVCFAEPIDAQAISPDEDQDQIITGEHLEIPLDVYKVLRVKVE